MMGQYLMDLKNEPTIHSLLRNMKNTFEYSFHQHHPQLHHLARPQQPDQVLDLSAKRRDSTETRKTTSPSSFEEGSPDTRNSPINPATQLLLHPRINIPKAQFTPEHSVQYHYNYDHSSPTSSNSMKPTSMRSPNEIFERFDSSAMLRKRENISPPPQPKTHSPQHFHIRPMISEPHHEDSNDLPAINSNISSSSSTASSQKSPSSTVSNAGMMVIGRDGKLSRPFKAYPRDPLSLAAAGSILDSSSAEKYSVFRKRMLEQIHAANGGNPVINNPKMRRITSKGNSHETNNNEVAYDSGSEKRHLQSSPSSGHDKDEAYFERRRKNNAAAKKSRDRRRIKEDEIAIRAAFLERENIELKFELAAARKQLTLYTSGLNS